MNITPKKKYEFFPTSELLCGYETHLSAHRAARDSFDALFDLDIWNLWRKQQPVTSTNRGCYWEDEQGKRFSPSGQSPSWWVFHGFPASRSEIWRRTRWRTSEIWFIPVPERWCSCVEQWWFQHVGISPLLVRPLTVVLVVCHVYIQLQYYSIPIFILDASTHFGRWVVRIL